MSNFTSAGVNSLRVGAGPCACPERPSFDAAQDQRRRVGTEADTRVRPDERGFDAGASAMPMPRITDDKLH